MKFVNLNYRNSKDISAEKFAELISTQHALFKDDDHNPLNWMVDYLANDSCWVDTIKSLLELSNESKRETLYLFGDWQVFVDSNSSTHYGIVAHNDRGLQNKIESMRQALAALRNKHPKFYSNTNANKDFQWLCEQGITW